jgi:hypothetical protein
MSEGQHALLPENVHKLIIHKMAIIAIPPGSQDPLAAGARVFLEPARFGAIFREASSWVQTAIGLIRNGPAPNPWKNRTDDDIAAEILFQIEEQNRKRKNAHDRTSKEDA